MTALRAGVVVELGEQASVQFAGDRSLRMRLVAVDPQPTYAGWVWLTGYVLDQRGNATARREVYVQRAGVTVLPPAQASPAPVPQRTTSSRPPGGTDRPNATRPPADQSRRRQPNGSRQASRTATH